MENENKNTMQTQAVNNMGNETQGADGAEEPKAERLFTQEEVNGFVQSRVNRLRSQIEKESKLEYEKKMAELNAREMKLTITEELSKRGMPKELSEVLTCADKDELDAKLDTLQKIYGNSNQDPTGKTEAIKVGVSTGIRYAGYNEPAPDPVRNAMGLDRR